MILKPEPVFRAYEQVLYELPKSSNIRVIFPTPDGCLLNHDKAVELSQFNNLVFINGHYKGIDQRIRDEYITKEISIGDFVLSGGELPAAMVCDSVIRLLPGVLGDETSALTDSFQDDLLAPPVYTRPAEWRGYVVPEVLLSGHAQKIEDWRHEQSLKRTQDLRPDLLD